jgi:hypothetical protein
MEMRNLLVTPRDYGDLDFLARLRRWQPRGSMGLPVALGRDLCQLNLVQDWHLHHFQMPDRGLHRPDLADQDSHGFLVPHRPQVDQVQRLNLHVAGHCLMRPHWHTLAAVLLSL